jgi:hypothetical protein
VKVVSMDARAETLLHYLGAGAADAARSIAGEVIADAEQMLRDKVVNPMGAAIGGYYLLGVGALERLHDWPNNFANWIDWLPDSAVIHAWQLLRTQGDGPGDRQEQARRRLLQATQRGLPVYSVGVRLLIDGLELFADAGGGSDDEVKQALRTIRPYAAAMDWSQELTLFYGQDPWTPLSQPITGVPSARTGLAWLS